MESKEKRQKERADEALVLALALQVARSVNRDVNDISVEEQSMPMDECLWPLGHVSDGVLRRSDVSPEFKKWQDLIQKVGEQMRLGIVKVGTLQPDWVAIVVQPDPDWFLNSVDNALLYFPETRLEADYRETERRQYPDYRPSRKSSPKLHYWQLAKMKKDPDYTLVEQRLAPEYQRYQSFVYRMLHSPRERTGEMNRLIGLRHVRLMQAIVSRCHRGAQLLMRRWLLLHPVTMWYRGARLVQAVLRPLAEHWQEPRTEDDTRFHFALLMGVSHTEPWHKAVESLRQLYKVLEDTHNQLKRINRNQVAGYVQTLHFALLEMERELRHSGPLQRYLTALHSVLEEDPIQRDRHSRPVIEFHEDRVRYGLTRHSKRLE